MQADLIKQISATIGKNKVVKLSRILAEKNTDLTELVNLTFNGDKGVAFRAAWLLENMLLEQPEQFLPSIPYIIKRIQYVSNPSCKRHYAKILMHLTSPKAPAAVRHAMAAINLKKAAEQCFEWLIDPAAMVAVKSFAAEALFNMRLRYPWIADELPAQLEFLMKDGTAGIRSKAKHLLSYFAPTK
jgi:hypothetical protein